jgi:hypothetical protein
MFYGGQPRKKPTSFAYIFKVKAMKKIRKIVSKGIKSLPFLSLPFLAGTLLGYTSHQVTFKTSGGTQ